MEKIKSGFIALSGASSKRVRIDLDLPGYIDKDAIGIHISNIERMCQMGGIRHFRVITESGDMSSSEVNIVGSTKQGIAFAGKGKSATVPTMKSESDPDERHPVTRCAEWTDVTARINIDEVAARINQDKKWDNGVRSTRAWAEYLNKDIKGSITREGIHHLVLGLSVGQFLFTAFADLPQSQKEYMDPLLFIRSVLISNLAANVVGHLFARLTSEESRYSFFFGPELDRAAILYVMSKTKTLVKSI